MARSLLFRLFTGLSLACFASIVGCNGAVTFDQPTDGRSSTATRISAALPEGYVYNGAERAMRAPIGPNALAAPSYVTEVGLRVSGPDIATRFFSVPLDTLAVAVTLTFGERTFDVLVKTKNGDTFTGTRTVMVDLATADVTIPLEVNAPPVIDRIDVSNTNPKPGDILTLTAFVTDPDPDDTLRYTWRAVGPDGGVKNATGQTVSFTMPPIAGTYTVTVTVDDGKGGSASKSGTATIDYAKPVIRGVTFGGTLYEGNTISATVDLFQLLTGYTIQWQFTKPDNTKVNVTGLTATLANAPGGDYSYVVRVTDQYGASATYSGSFTVSCAAVTVAPTLSATASSSANGTINLSWTAVTNAKSYQVQVLDNASSLVRTDKGLTGTTKAMVEPVGQLRAYKIAGADCLGKVGPWATQTTAITAPGIHQPVDLGQAGSTVGSTVLYWTSDTGPVTPATTPTKYTIKITDNGAGTSSSVGPVTYVSSANYWSSTCPGGAGWTGACGRYAHTCAGGTSYSYTVQEGDGTFTSDSSATYTYTCQ